MIGRVYRWRGDVWEVLARWEGRGPRNVLIRCERTGERVVRPFRGLRRIRGWVCATSARWHRSRRCAEARARGWAAFPVEEAFDPSFYGPCGVCAR